MRELGSKWPIRSWTACRRIYFSTSTRSFASSSGLKESSMPRSASKHSRTRPSLLKWSTCGRWPYPRSRAPTSQLPGGNSIDSSAPCVGDAAAHVSPAGHHALASVQNVRVRFEPECDVATAEAPRTGLVRLVREQELEKLTAVELAATRHVAQVHNLLGLRGVAERSAPR